MIATLLAAAVSLQPCDYGGAKAQCGSVAVPENRAASQSRTIPVHFVVVRTASHAPEEPLFGMAGGPGQSAIDTFRDGFARSPLFGPLVRERDVVMVDQRGTGKSHPLSCQLFPTDVSTYRYLFPPGIVCACRDRLATTSDLDAYGSSAAADDLDDVRAALSYRKIVLYGGSYGTTESLIYMRRHGDRVRAAVFEGVAPPWMLVPLPFPRGAQHALDDLERSCAADALCRREFPHFPGEFATLLQRSRHGIPVAGGAISFEVFVDRIRQSLYDAYVASYVPFIVHRAATGDPEPLRKLIAFLAHGIPGSLSIGMNLSVVCAESMPFISAARARAAAEGTFMGDVRYRAERAACDVWNVKPVSPRFLDPIRSSAPVLMLNGADDPATPAQFASQEGKYLPNGRLVIVPHAGHDFGSECTVKMELAFLRTYNARALDASCLHGQSRPPFATSLKGLFY